MQILQTFLVSSSKQHIDVDLSPRLLQCSTSLCLRGIRIKSEIAIMLTMSASWNTMSMQEVCGSSLASKLILMPPRSCSRRPKVSHNVKAKGCACVAPLLLTFVNSGSTAVGPSGWFLHTLKQSLDSVQSLSIAHKTPGVQLTKCAHKHIIEQHNGHRSARSTLHA